MQIALYHSPGPIGWAIQWRTWSYYSHAAHVLPGGSIVEAHFDGIKQRSTPLTGYGKSTVVDVFNVLGITDAQGWELRELALQRVHEKQTYDWRGILGFVFRLPVQDKSQAFCSEMVFEDYQSVGINLLSRIPAYKVSPGLLAYSPLLEHDTRWRYVDGKPDVQKVEEL